ncbi:tetratricopeptide repeat protein [Murinocardiopsis flavida]|nr:tetratricopeptide repeat protein [Murinocardiopsis flavida]
MTATAGAPVPEAEQEFADLCEQGRDLAENGHLQKAAQVYERVIEGGSQRHRARAALGLAVVRFDLGEVKASREADRRAIDTGHAEFAPRAAYHLAVGHEAAGEAAEAAAAWREVLGFDNPRYHPAAHYGLARAAEERGDDEAAREHWDRVVGADAAEPGGPEAAVVAEAARDRAERLLARGEVDAAEEVAARGLRAAEDPALRVVLGAVYVERAIAEFGAAAAASEPEPEGPSAAPPVDPAVAGAAFELLARLLSVRGDPESAAKAWEDGLGNADPGIAGEVRARVRRGFLAPEDTEDAEEGGESAAPWWDPYIEAAVAQESTPMLTGELFAALDRIYTQLAVPHAGNESRASALRTVLAEAVLTPSEYVWGRALHDDFRERLRRASGGQAHVLPEGWPEER